MIRKGQGFTEHIRYFNYGPINHPSKEDKENNQVLIFYKKNSRWISNSNHKAMAQNLTCLELSISWQNTSNFLFNLSSLKKTEHLFKSCIYDSKRISAVPPQFYKERFLDFLKYDVFKLADKRIKLPISPRKSPLAEKGS